MEAGSNLYVKEGTLSGTLSLVLPWKARFIEIINDNSSGTLKYKFNESEDYATLKPLEAVTANTKSKTIYLLGSGGAYRIRGEG